MMEGGIQRRVRRKRNVDRGEQPAIERREMRGEHEAAIELENLLDLGRVTMRRHAVSLQILVSKAEMRACRRLLAGRP